VHKLNVRAPPPALPDALRYTIKSAVIEDQRKRDNCEASAGEQFEGLCLLPQQNIFELEQLATKSS
jgi:hypothetical protein